MINLLNLVSFNYYFLNRHCKELFTCITILPVNSAFRLACKRAEHGKCMWIKVVGSIKTKTTERSTKSGKSIWYERSKKGDFQTITGNMLKY